LVILVTTPAALGACGGGTHTPAPLAPPAACDEAPAVRMSASVVLSTTVRLSLAKVNASSALSSCAWD
jgi:hypothetical protein